MLSDHEHGKGLPHGLEAVAIPAYIFGGGLTDEQKVGLERITDCMERAEVRMQNMVDGNDPALMRQYEALYRVLHGIADGAAMPIMQLVTEGADPISAFKQVLAGVGGMMFMAGVEFGLHESTPAHKQSPVQPQREKTARLTDEERQQAMDLLSTLEDVSKKRKDTPSAAFDPDEE